MDELVVLPERAAVRSFFDGLNARNLFRFLIVLAPVTFAGAALTLAEGRYPELGLAAVTLVIIRLFYAGRDHATLQRYFRPFLLGYLSVQFLQLRSLFEGNLWGPVDVVLPLTLLFFRLNWPLLLIPLGALWSASAGSQLLNYFVTDLELDLWTLVVPSATSALTLMAGSALTKSARSDFIDKWRTAQRRYHERRRMREELGDARRIQLSMLPAREPRLDWLDIAGISIPASEVGGDYYDYFRISDSRWVIVVADVAGHGMASGLLLSGIRSCLHLLHLDLPEEPAVVLSKLDRTIRRTSTRHFVTLLYTLFDLDQRTVTFAAAGHPPLLCYRSRDRTVEELSQPSLPLGTALHPVRGQQTLSFDHDDIFLLYTDGIAETMNAAGTVYGYQQLHHRLRATDHDRNAKEIRNTLLGDIVAFKGDEEQTDDITLVVIKVL